MPNLKDNQPRIESIDVLRGFALLGILIMNIQSFGLLAEFYINPLLVVDGQPPAMADLVSHAVSYALADQKFITIFSILFGTGLAMQYDSCSKRGRYYLVRRNIVLLVIGMLHAYLLWPGDILVAYAVCGFVAIALLNQNSRVLLVFSLILFSVPMVLSILNAQLLPYYSADDLLQMDRFWQPSASMLEQQVSAMTGSWWQTFMYRIPQTVEMQVVIFPMEIGWRVLSLMLFGIYLYRSGFYQPYSWPSYNNIIFLCGAVGGLIIIVGLYFNYLYQWQVAFSLFYGTLFNYVGSAFMAMVYISAILLLCKFVWFTRIRLALANVGRLALSNYLLQTIVCTTIFYGHGLGLFATLSRAELWLLLPPMWLSQTMLSCVYLKFFKRGPVEYLWRFLSDMKASNDEGKLAKV